jgi:membrane-bound ClpP family serine protease
MLWPILLLLLGLSLVLAETLIPSGGLLGFGAAACVIGAIVLAFHESSEAGRNFLVATAVLLPIVVGVGLKLFPHTSVGKAMVNPGLSFEGEAATDRRDLELLGQTGTTTSPLRPAGHALIGGRRVDVVSRGEHLDLGTDVTVLEVRGNRVVVGRSSESA